ncbi:hypothetical protein O181_004628 [Austropuccinia psidii MF-1]|uniref:Uncharacterized protein n=1 Tax=Austropuccinia psidii MF-1 TaxID=1389203 RepID=A0A9Q3BGQ9_9BASI|nr:hypothetical protein [Austropuccinia psidii MF-1]
MFGFISLVLYNVIAPKPYVEPTTDPKTPLEPRWGQAEYLTSCLIKWKQSAIQLSIEVGGADNELLTNPQKKLEELMDKAIHLMIAYNMVRAHTKVKVYGIESETHKSERK